MPQKVIHYNSCTLIFIVGFLQTTALLNEHVVILMIPLSPESLLSRRYHVLVMTGGTCGLSQFAIVSPAPVLDGFLAMRLNNFAIRKEVPLSACGIPSSICPRCGRFDFMKRARKDVRHATIMAIRWPMSVPAFVEFCRFGSATPIL